MLLSFVANTEDVGTLGVTEHTEVQVLPTVPHPWTSIVPEMMRTISQVAKLLRTNRQDSISRTFWSEANVDRMREAIEKSRQLEVELLNATLPSEADIADPGDNTTLVSHFLAIAQAYRLVALLQIYRVFPDVHIERFFSSDSASALEHLHRSISVAWTYPQHLKGTNG